MSETLISIGLAALFVFILVKLVPDLFTAIIIIILVLIAYAFIRPRVGRSL